MRILTGITLAVCFFSVSVFADVSMSAAGAVEFTKKGGDASEKNIDKSFIRAELKAKGTLENSGLEALIHLRSEPSVTQGTKYTPLQPRQIYLKLPVSMVEILMGRWYDIYGPGYYYFGRYLHGVSSSGSGNMNTDYSVIDGLNLSLNFESIKSKFQLGFLPQDANFEDIYLMAMFGGSPVEGLKFNIGGNFEVITPEDEATHRAVVNAGYTFLKETKTGFFLEAAIVDFEEVADNTWLLFGLTTAAGFIDRIQAEIEFKSDRLMDGTNDADLAWMLLIRKKVMGLCFDLNVGADPKTLGSTTPGDVGGILRISAKF